MQRRSFLKAGSIAGLTTLVAGACNTVSTGKKEDEKDDNYVDQFELNEVTITMLQQKCRTRNTLQGR